MASMLRNFTIRAYLRSLFTTPDDSVVRFGKDTSKKDLILEANSWYSSFGAAFMGGELNDQRKMVHDEITCFLLHHRYAKTRRLNSRMPLYTRGVQWEFLPDVPNSSPFSTIIKDSQAGHIAVINVAMETEAGSRLALECANTRCIAFTNTCVVITGDIWLKTFTPEDLKDIFEITRSPVEEVK